MVMIRGLGPRELPQKGNREVAGSNPAGPTNPYADMFRFGMGWVLWFRYLFCSLTLLEQVGAKHNDDHLADENLHCSHGIPFP